VLARAALVAFVPTLDLERSHAFYGGVLGLRRVEASPFANAYHAGGAALRVTRVEQLPPAAHTVLGWDVAELGAVLRDLTARGIAVRRYDGLDQDDAGIWTAPGGTRVAWFADPDGNTLSLSETTATA
jgi:catechol 2,3-dioxygenase-like lactoylglutathione lyase family enzyme